LVEDDLLSPIAQRSTGVLHHFRERSIFSKKRRMMNNLKKYHKSIGIELFNRRRGRLNKRYGIFHNPLSPETKTKGIRGYFGVHN
jgi:hypothetical protein